MLLGADFLRAHRVLFAMSQNRLYISYLGGDVFSRAARASNRGCSRKPTAAMRTPSSRWPASYRNGSGVAGDAALAGAWLEKAAQQGHPPAPACRSASRCCAGRQLHRGGHRC